MKASKLIEEIEVIIKEYGDIEIKGDGEYDFFSPTAQYSQNEGIIVITEEA